MVDINWLDYFILVLAGFSVNYLIINEAATFISKKSNLTKWVVCFVASFILVLLHKYSPYSFIFLLTLSLTGAVDIIIHLLMLAKKEKKLSIEVESKQLLDAVDLMINHYQNLSQKENIQNKVNPTSVSKNTKTKTVKKSEESSLPAKSDSKEPKIIKSKRLYGLEEFLRESEGQNVVLSPSLRSNLGASKPTESKKT